MIEEMEVQLRQIKKWIVRLPFRFCSRGGLILGIILATTAGVQVRAQDQEPTIRAFLGLNGHTVQFKPELYAPVTRRVRDYHGLNWDLGDDTSNQTSFPFANNRVNWKKVYGSWQEHGHRVNASIVLDGYKPDEWTDLADDAFRYGKSFASYFGPSGEGLVHAAEVGNEPGEYSDEQYRTVFQNMAKGFRKGDPEMTVVTCAMVDGESGKYHKSLSCIRGLNKLYDVISVHSYPMLETWPTWKRTFPEDPQLDGYLSRVKNVIAWRNEHAPQKEIWLTEFGYDASTKDPPEEGTFRRWKDVSDRHQAQWLVRSVLLFSKLDLDRAYIYFFNDSDEPKVHGSSGLTRNFEPKPSFHAIAHLQDVLGSYRFDSVVTERSGKRYVYRYRDTKKNRMALVAWSPTGSGRERQVTIRVNTKKDLIHAERMALTADGTNQVPVERKGDRLTVKISESPVYLIFK